MLTSIKRGAVMAVLLCLPLAACSESSKEVKVGSSGAQAPSTSAPSPSTTTVAAGSGATPTTTPRGGSPVTTAPARVSSGSANTTPPTTAAGPTTSLPEGQFPSKASVNKTCIAPGASQTVSVQTVSNAVVTYVMTYSDQRSHGNNNGGLADGKGKYADSFVVGPDAPKGTAWVHFSSGTKEKGTSFAEASFTVGC